MLNISCYKCLNGIQFLINRKFLGLRDTTILSGAYSKIASGFSYHTSIEFVAGYFFSSLPSLLMLTFIIHDLYLSKFKKGVKYSDLYSKRLGSTDILTQIKKQPSLPLKLWFKREYSLQPAWNSLTFWPIFYYVNLSSIIRILKLVTTINFDFLTKYATLYFSDSTLLTMY